MDRRIVHSLAPVVLVGGGQVRSEDLDAALKLGTRVVAADAGLDRALAAGVVPEAVIGDLDSVSAEGLAQLKAEDRHQVSEQDSTDFDKALRHVAAPVVIGVGFTEGRLDHQLAVLHSLLVHAHRPCVLLGQEEITLLAPPQIRVPTREGDVVSLFPLVPVSGRSLGLKWPIDGLAFAPGKKIGTSNVAHGPVELELDGPGMILMLPRALIQPVVAALSQVSAPRWPAP